MPIQRRRDVKGAKGVNEVTERRKISRADFEAALNDPDLAPAINAAMRVRGIDPDRIFPGGAPMGIWSKTYTESTSATLSDPETGDQVAAFDLPPTTTELTVLSQISEVEQHRWTQ
jgi:hypothetical protein